VPKKRINNERNQASREIDNIAVIQGAKLILTGKDTEIAIKIHIIVRKSFYVKLKKVLQN
jgi:hypothetical protein